MKRFICIILALSVILTLASCGGSEKAENGKETVSLNLLTAEKLAALPVANDKMSKAELRQLCIDFFELQLSFQWTPDFDVTDWNITLVKNYPEKTLLKANLYAGIPYQAGRSANGNLYRWLEYMDQKTGVMALEKAFRDNGGYGEDAEMIDVKKDGNGKITYKKYRSMLTMFNHCSSSSFWGWSRVVNSANFDLTSEMTLRNGFIPVGCYTYPNAESIDSFGKKTEGNPDKYDTDNVIVNWNMKNDPMAMYECYAKLKPADGVVSDGHAMMVRSVEVKRTKNGMIDINNSTVHVLEQIEGWGTQTKLDGKDYKIQGRTNCAYTFKYLLEEAYIPFTFAELLDPDDPQDKEHLDYYNSYRDRIPHFEDEYSAFDFTTEELTEMTGAGVEKARVFNTLGRESGRITFEELKNMTVGANYPVSDVFIISYGKDGKQILKNVYRAATNRTRQVAMSANKSTWEKDENGELVPLYSGFENAENVEVAIQLSTGELLTAFSGEF